MDILEQIYNFSTIEDLTYWVLDQDESFLRHYLLREFDKRRFYKTADEWNEVVRICEALAIVGWGKRTRLDAIATRVSNWRHTEFITENGKNCYRYGRWLKRKAGFYITNCHAYQGPEHNNRASIEYVETKEENIVFRPAEKLLSQRNYLVQFQFKFLHEGSLIGGLGDVSFLVPEYWDELYGILKDCFDPSLYSAVLEDFFITVRVGWVKDIWSIKIGPYNSKRKSFDAYVRIDRDFVEQTETEQRMVVVQAMQQAVKAFINKLEKRKINFPSQQFESDVNLALMKFAQRKGTISGDRQNHPIMEMLQGFASAVEEHQAKKV